MGKEPASMRGHARCSRKLSMDSRYTSFGFIIADAVAYCELSEDLVLPFYPHIATVTPTACFALCFTCVGKARSLWIHREHHL